jgi:hypothetical protein
MVADHHKEGSGGSAKTLPTLQDHLKLAEQTRKGQKAGGKVAAEDDNRRPLIRSRSIAVTALIARRTRHDGIERSPYRSARPACRASQSHCGHRGDEACAPPGRSGGAGDRLDDGECPEWGALAA